MYYPENSQIKLEFKSESYLYNAKCEIDNEWNDGETEFGVIFEKNTKIMTVSFEKGNSREIINISYDSNLYNTVLKTLNNSLQAEKKSILKYKNTIIC